VLNHNKYASVFDRIYTAQLHQMQLTLSWEEFAEVLPDTCLVYTKELQQYLLCDLCFIQQGMDVVVVSQRSYLRYHQQWVAFPEALKLATCFTAKPEVSLGSGLVKVGITKALIEWRLYAKDDKYVQVV
jgi:hypothetical protein